MNVRLQVAGYTARLAVFPAAFLLLQGALGQAVRVSGVTALSADRQGCCYVVTGNGVAKYGAQLELLARYTCSFGRIESIDASDPFKISLFCKDFLRLQLLDSKLSTLGNPVFLPDAGVLRPVAVCRSSGNGMWIADAYRRQLLHLDFTLNTLREVASLDAYTNNDEQPVSRMAEREEKVFVSLGGKSIAVFDKFGALLHLFSVPEVTWFDVQGSKLYYLSGGNLYAQNLLSWSEPPNLVAANVEHCAVAGSVIYTCSGGELTKKTGEPAQNLPLQP
ncbi:MAG: hypothetical protein LBB79_06240 [Prevotellaceae bacterium]|jgi:hypothetical protein|nr:hypothetical protein [Prevotellaceae bacterium]